jgi:hypothetical protein
VPVAQLALAQAVRARLIRGEAAHRLRTGKVGEEQLQQSGVASFATPVLRLGEPTMQRHQPGIGDRVGAPPAAAALDRFLEQAGVGELARLGVQLRVGEQPEAADGGGDPLLELVGRHRPERGDHPQHQVGGRGQRAHVVALHRVRVHHRQAV